MTDDKPVSDPEGASASATGAGSAGDPSLSDALAQAQETAQENWGKYLRTAAELENVRKRAARDVEQARKFGVERLAGELLAVLDSLEMGVEAGGAASVEALLEGKKATLRLLKAALEKFGVAEIIPDGQAFDPQLHEALSIQPSAAVEPGAVIAVVQKGYQLNGRLLRPARVVVAGAAPDARGDVSGGGSTDPVGGAA
jgi:molecular chaperone GrpE